MTKTEFNELIKKESHDFICCKIDGFMDSPIYQDMFSARVQMIFFSFLKSLIHLRDEENMKLDYDIFFENFKIDNIKKMIKNKSIPIYLREAIYDYIRCLNDGTYYDERYIEFPSDFHSEAIKQLKLRISD